jgi:hypothetical protein
MLLVAVGYVTGRAEPSPVTMPRIQHHPANHPTSRPASRPAIPTLNGKVKSIDTASGQVKLAWKHPRMRTEQEVAAKLAAGVQVSVDGKPAQVGDIRIGDFVELVGKGETVGGQNQYVVNKVLVSRQPPASAPAKAIPQVDQILDRLEKKGDQVRDIQSRITFSKIDPVLEDKQIFYGILRFKEDKPNPRFFIRFDKFTQEGMTREVKEWHVFDGQWYIEAREKTKTIVKRQVVRPGEAVNVFRLGQGPFPLPFGQKKADIEKHFSVKLIEPQVTDPPNSFHVECTPKPGSDMEKRYGKIDFYIDKALDLPVRVRTTEKSENVQVIADFPASSIEINKGLDGGELTLPDLGEYQVDTVPLSDER